MLSCCVRQDFGSLIRFDAAAFAPAAARCNYASLREWAQTWVALNHTFCCAAQQVPIWAATRIAICELIRRRCAGIGPAAAPRRRPLDKMRPLPETDAALAFFGQFGEKRIMFNQLLVPVDGNLILSFAAAALPIATVLVALGILRRPAWQASLAGLIVGLVIGIFVWNFPPGLALDAVAAGAVFALWPVMWIVFNALLLYNIAVISGRF